MANISKELETIRKSVYGWEIRADIANAMEKMNTDLQGMKTAATAAGVSAEQEERVGK